MVPIPAERGYCTFVACFAATILFAISGVRTLARSMKINSFKIKTKKMKTISLIAIIALMTTLSATQSFAQANAAKTITMKRYVVERTFPNGLIVPINEEGSKLCLTVVSKNLEDNVTWVHSYVTMDKKKSYCIYDAPSPEAIRRSAEKTGLPVGSIIEVSVLDPYFYK